MNKTLKRLVAAAAALVIFSGTTVSASVLNIYVDSREEMIASVDGAISDAFNNRESEVNISIAGNFVGQFKASDGKFAPDEEYFMSTVPILKYKYTEGNDYTGLKMDQVATEAGFTYDQHTSVVNSFNIAYRVNKWHETPEETDYVNKFVSDNITGVLAGADTQYDKVKNIHDWMVLKYDYAYSDTYNAKSHSAYGMITNGRGVCSAYTLLFDAFCRAAGLRTRIVFSEKTYAVTGSTFVVHCWNMVEVDGIWYHIDVTWDDQPHLGKGVVYNYFLKSSDYFLKNSHLWDDRTDGIGTPYPAATRNNGNAPGADWSENMTRPIEGSKPQVVEKVVGSESSVPDVVELSESSAEPVIMSSDREVAASQSNSPIVAICAAVVLAAAVAVVLFVIFRRRGKHNKTADVQAETAQTETKPDEVKKPEARDASYDSYDSYDGFDN